MDTLTVPVSPEISPLPHDCVRLLLNSRDRPTTKRSFDENLHRYGTQEHSWKTPPSVYLGEKRGPANWGVPSSYDWTMYWQTESTTTRIARPGPNGDCTALVRHDAVLIDDAPQVRVLRIEGAC